MPEGTGIGTLLGFDPGERHIGVAVGEGLIAQARALGTLQAQDGKPEPEALAELVGRWAPQAAVVGITRHADGTDASSTVAARHLAEQIQSHVALPIYTVDERLSSHAAAQRLNARARRQDPSRLHGEAAAVILETFLSQQGAA